MEKRGIKGESMNILIKYTLKSMMEKKFRSFLIILAIALAGGLFLASSGLTSSISDTYSNMLQTFYGEAEIVVTTNKDSPTNYVSISGCNQVVDVANRVVPFIGGSAEYKKPGALEKDYISIMAYHMEDYLAINKLVVLEGSIEDFNGAKLILSKKGAEKLGLSVGEEITIDILGKRKVTLAAIVDNEGVFKYEEGTTQGMMPFETICKYIKSNNRAANIYIDVKEGIDIDEAIAKYQEAYPKYTVERTINADELEQQMSSITMPFMLMTFIVIFMSAFIIYSSFKVIMLEKLPVVGTFRSVGATKTGMNGVLLMEAIFYGVIGGISACLLGTGALRILSSLMLGMMGGEGVEMSCSVPINTYILTFFIGVVMAILSTILPIMSVSKISLKDIILNNRPHKGKKYLRGTIIGVSLIVIGLMIPKIIAGDRLMMTSVIGLFVVIIGMIKVVPAIVLYASQGLGLIFNLIFGNIGELATKNIKKNSSVLNSITLITIGISILFSISTMTRNVSDQVLGFYKETFKCDILGWVGNCDDQMVRIIKRNTNIERIIESIDVEEKVEEFKDATLDIEGFQTTQLLPDLNLNIQGDEPALLQELQEGRNIIVSTTVREKYKLNVGDTITIKFEKTPRQYTVIGYMDTINGDGFYGIVPMKYLKKDAEVKTYSMLYIRAKEGANLQETCTQVGESLADLTYADLIPVEQQAKANEENNASLMSMISIFAVLAMVIGIVGVINNLMISFIERKQNMAMLRSVGMSKWQVLKMIFIEGLGSGVISAVSGLSGGILACYSLDYVLKGMETPIHMEVVPELVPGYLIGGILITVIGSIIPARGSSKLNIIEAIKYE